MITLIELPLVLPPAAAGIALLAAFGPKGLVGGAIEDAGITLVLQTAGVVVAMAFVAAPFYVRGAIAAFEAVNQSLLDASRTLGRPRPRRSGGSPFPEPGPDWPPGSPWPGVAPSASSGRRSSSRASLQGRTQTAPLAIFEFLSRDFDSALALSGVLVIFSAALLLGVKLLGGAPEVSRAGS